MMMMVNQRHPFTESQLKEFELQTLIFNYIISGIPVPSHLITHFKRSIYFFDHYPSMRFVKKTEEDPEPWRCKRTDGKKWRCSKEAFLDSKYCERHMHRGKKSSRKLVEFPKLALNNTFRSIDNDTQLILGPSSPCNQSYKCYNFFKEESEEEKRKKEAQKAKPLLCLFSESDEKRKRSWVDTEEAYYSKTQLSISIL
ncbi:uncharacterized protein A4U43_C03F12070 [Asparagus officinalis]|uniref:Growth-regulating factor n=1 Tax=Asparagus officinalis TaxID=4686 RepID=A0A5P1FEJ7_ASPOF|nr:growth-regulating factor 1-like [Asparagus officinalis]ONK74980.1 uncharacterized protein A4U43_C03F12070 [Asparagus officinalis]